MTRILIIEDDFAIRDELAILLQKAGYMVTVMKEFHNAVQQMRQEEYDLILMDISLEGENGEMILQEFRKTDDTPVIMLTSSSEEIDEVLSISYGADDYITKPYNPTILLLRISAILKRSQRTNATQKYKDAVFSAVKGSLTRNDKEQILTKNETIIFQILLDNVGEIVSQDSIMTALWNNEEFINENALFTNISRLRVKLSELGLENVIETRKKQGYILR